MGRSQEFEQGQQTHMRADEITAALQEGDGWLHRNGWPGYSTAQSLKDKPWKYDVTKHMPGVPETKREKAAREQGKA